MLSALLNVRVLPACLCACVCRRAFAASQNATLGSLLGSAMARRIVLNHIIPVRPFTSRAIPSTNATGPITLPSAQPGDLLNVTSTGGAS